MALSNFRQDESGAFRVDERWSGSGGTGLWPVVSGVPPETVGHSYWWGRGVQKNCRRAFEWFWKAAWYGDAEANTYVGMCFHDGVVVKKNFKKALKYYRFAAAKKDGYAQYCLGLCYRDGDGVTKSRRLAQLWLKKSADNGEKHAVKALKKLNSLE